MRSLTALLLATVLLASFPAVAREKHKRKKDKRFDPVAISGPAAVEGNYRGVTDDQILELRVGRDGKLMATLREDGLGVPLRDVVLTGNTFTAANGLRGSFVERTLNGEKAFGVMITGLDIHLDETTVLQRIFFKRVSP